MKAEEYSFGKTRVIIDDSYVRKGEELDRVLKGAGLKWKRPLTDERPIPKRLDI